MPSPNIFIKIHIPNNLDNIIHVNYLNVIFSGLNHDTNSIFTRFYEIVFFYSVNIFSTDCLAMEYL